MWPLGLCQQFVSKCTHLRGHSSILGKWALFKKMKIFLFNFYIFSLVSGKKYSSENINYYKLKTFAFFHEQMRYIPLIKRNFLVMSSTIQKHLRERKPVDWVPSLPRLEIPFFPKYYFEINFFEKRNLLLLGLEPRISYMVGWNANPIYI